ncbi:MAG: hypothetical protein SV760_01210 [Halobacteria archaeon]|nr:hypothetical protein [Halobacteria archaeon]
MVDVSLATRMDAPRERVFDLSRCVDLQPLPSSRGDTKGADEVREVELLNEDDVLTWRLRNFGFTLEPKVRVTGFEKPESLRYDLVEGPFESMVFKRVFEEKDGDVVVKDLFRFESGFGPLGAVIDMLHFRHYIRSLAMDRNCRLQEVAESDEWREYLE